MVDPAFVPTQQASGPLLSFHLDPQLSFTLLPFQSCSVNLASWHFSSWWQRAFLTRFLSTCLIATPSKRNSLPGSKQAVRWPSRREHSRRREPDTLVLGGPIAPCPQCGQKVPPPQPPVAVKELHVLNRPGSLPCKLALASECLLPVAASRSATQAGLGLAFKALQSLHSKSRTNYMHVW